MGDSRDMTDRQRFSEWLDHYGPALRGYLAATTRDPHRSDDLLQEVFRRAWRARESYREDGRARAYLFRIADRLVCDAGRRATRECQLDPAGWARVEPVAMDVAPEAAAMQEEAARQLAEALDRISPVQQRVLLLRYYSQLSFPEIAAVMNCPLNTVLSHARRGLLVLRGILVDCAP